jgi:hypothetical protein
MPWPIAATALRAWPSSIKTLFEALSLPCFIEKRCNLLSFARSLVENRALRTNNRMNRAVADREQGFRCRSGLAKAQRFTHREKIAQMPVFHRRSFICWKGMTAQGIRYWPCARDRDQTTRQ